MSASKIGNVKKFRSISFPLNMTLLLLCTIIFIAYSIDIYFYARTIKLFVNKQQEVIAQKAVLSIKNFIQDKIVILEQAAFVSNLADADPHQKNIILQKLLGKEKGFRKLVLLDTNMTELAVASRLSRYSFDGSLQHIPKSRHTDLQKKSFIISEVLIDEKTCEPIIIISVPIRNIFGDFRGTFYAVTDLKFMWDLMENLKIGKNGQAFLVDKKGRLIAYKDVSRVLKGENVSYLKEVDEFVTGTGSLEIDSSSEITKGIHGTYVVTNHINLGVPDWGIVFELPVKEAYLPVIRGIIGSIITILLCFLVAIISSVYLSRKFIRPLIILRDAAKQIGHGELNIEVQNSSANEFGELASSFNTMIKELRSSTTSIENLRREILERKNAEDKLRDSEEKFRTLSISLPIGVMLIRTDGNILFSNSQWDALFGFKDTTVKWDGWERLTTPEFLPIIVKSWEKLLSQNGIFSEEFSIINSEKKLIWLNVKALTLLSDEGTKIILIAEDISNRKRAEKESEQTRMQLIQSEKLAGIGQLAAGVAHEINNPVGFVLGNSETLVDYFQSIKQLIEFYESILNKNDIIEKRKELDMEYILGDIDSLMKDNIKGLQRIIAIVTNLKNFARIEQSNEITEADLEENINNTLSIAKNEIKYHADIKTEFGNIGPVWCNIGEINQVLLNIIINAVQAIQEQHRNDRGLIIVKTGSSEEEVFCSITDDGPGIKEENLRKIFDPFFTTKPVGKGTGLGLNIAWDIIVNRHKGKILVDSTIGKGTCFTIKLPRK